MSLHLPEEVDLIPRVELIGEPGLVEPRSVEKTSPVPQRHPYHGGPFARADLIDGDDPPPYTDLLSVAQSPDRGEARPILEATGKVCKEILDRTDPQLMQPRSALLSHTLCIADGEEKVFGSPRLWRRLVPPSEKIEEEGDDPLAIEVIASAVSLNEREGIGEVPPDELLQPAGDRAVVVAARAFEPQNLLDPDRHILVLLWHIEGYYIIRYFRRQGECQSKLGLTEIRSSAVWPIP